MMRPSVLWASCKRRKRQRHRSVSMGKGRAIAVFRGNGAKIHRKFQGSAELCYMCRSVDVLFKNSRGREIIDVLLSAV